MFISPACAGAGRVIGSPVRSHSFRSFSPCVFSSCFHNDFDGIHSLVPFVAAGARLVGSDLFPLGGGGGGGCCGVCDGAL